MNKKTEIKGADRALPPELSDVGFVDIRDVSSAVCMSVAWVHAEVAAGRFPKPLRLGPRCSRWTRAAIRQYLIDRANKADADPAIDARISATAKKASAAASLKRKAAVGARGARL